MPLVNTQNLISISNANKMGVSGLAKAAENGREFVILRNNRPVAAVISMSDLERLEQLQEDLEDLTLVAARLLTDTGQRVNLDAILAHEEFTRDELRGE